MLALLTILVGMQAAQQISAHKAPDTKTWKVTLLSVGPNKIEVINVVKEELEITLQEALSLVDTAPVTLLENAYYEDANRLYERLVNAGATATIIDVDPTYYPPTYTGTVNYTVTLQNNGSSKLAVIQVLQNQLGLGLKEAKDLADAVPCVVLETTDYEKAKALLDALIGAGATATLDASGGGLPDVTEGTWLITLTEVTSKLSLIALLREKLEIGLTEAKILTETAPCVICCGKSFSQSIDLTKSINESGYGSAFTMRVEDGTMATPTNVAITDLTQTHGVVSWNAGASEQKWIVRYGVPTTMSPHESQTWDFEDKALGFDGWTTIDADGDGYGWELAGPLHSEAIFSTYSGDGCVASASYRNDLLRALTPDDWLVSPKLELGGVFKFWARGQDPNYSHEHFAVFVSTNGNTNPSDFVQVSEEFIASGEYKEYTIDLSAYSGEGYVAIRHFNVTDEYWLNIDNISYDNPNWVPISDNWKYALDVTNNPHTLTALTPETNYYVQVLALGNQCNNASGWSKAKPMNTKEMLAPEGLFCFNMAQTETSLQWYPQSEESKWRLRYWKDKVDEGFESGTLNPIWNVIDTNGNGKSWTVKESGSGSSLVHHGSHAITSDDATGDEWLVIPLESQSSFLTFWATTNYYDASSVGNFAIYVSPDDCEDPSTFIQVSPTWKWPKGWKMFTLDLSDALNTDEIRSLNLGMIRYVAIRAYGGKGSCWLWLDDLALLNGHLDGNEWVEDWTDEWNVTDNSWHDLTDLEMDTDYNVMVQGLFDNDERTPWTDVLQFRTWSDIVFINDGQWTDASCWYKGEVPPADADVIIAADCEIPSGYTAKAKSVVMDNATIILKDGGQLRCGTDKGTRLVVAFEKELKANTYYYLRMPLNFTFPDEMLDGSYTLEYFDQSYGWQPISAKNLETRANNSESKYYNYRYRRNNDLTVQLCGTPPADNTRISNVLYITPGANYAGYNLVGNTLTCNAWPCYDSDCTTQRPYWVMNDKGEFVEGSGPIAPLQAVFVKREGPGDERVWWAHEEPQYIYPVATPYDVHVSGVGGTTAYVSWMGNGGELRWNVRYRKSDNATHQAWDFENGEQGWTNLDGDGDGYKWFYNSGYGRNSWGCMKSNTWNATDNWLISPKVELGGIVSFWAKGYYSSSKPEHFTVYVSPNNFDTANFQLASQEFEVNSSYKQFSVDLSDIGATGKGYFIIRHHNSPNGGDLSVDDVTYMSYPAEGYMEPGTWRNVNNLSTQAYGMQNLEPETRYDVQVQAVFPGTDRISEWSDIVRFTTGNGPATGVDEFDANQSHSTEMYDLQGRRVSNKANRGIYINRPDGSRKAKKLVVK